MIVKGYVHALVMALLGFGFLFSKSPILISLDIPVPILLSTTRSQYIVKTQGKTLQAFTTRISFCSMENVG